MSLKDTWTPQDTTMDASPDIPNMLADAIIQNESDIVKAQKTADSANKTAAAVSGQLADMNVAIQANTDGILNTNINVSQLAERVVQNEADIKELQESGGSGEQEIFVVTCQASYIDETTNMAYPLTVDKSIKEIIDAINEGKSIQAVMFKDGSDYFLSSTTYRTMQRTYTEYGWDSGEDIEVPYDSVCFSFREPDSATVYEWIFTKTSGNIDGFWEVNVSELADKTYVDEAVADAEEIMHVTLTQSSDGTLTSDKTFDEMYEAVQSGKTVVAVYGVERLTLTKIAPAILWFSSSFSTGDWNGKMRTLMCIKNSDADVWGDHEINLAGTAYVDDAVADLKKASVFRVSCYTNGDYHGCTKKNSEIVDAIHNGRNIVATFSLSGGSEMAWEINSCLCQIDKKLVDKGGLGVWVEYVIFKFFDGSSVWTVEFDPQTEQWCVNGEQPMVPTPVKGVDYWTEADKAEIKTYVEDAILGGAW